MLEPSGEPQVFETGALLASRYEVVNSVGSGGMGWVVHAVDRALDNKSVALKLLYPHLVKDERAFGRFRNEVMLAQDLSHPNIVRMHDLGVTERGQYFISMEYVHGSSLKDLILATQGRGVPFEDALKILYEISLGVAHAHSKGIIHRDLKPDNVLISKIGEVKIVDFGIARSLWQDHGLTKTGGAVGTPYYMAPEQIRGEDLDERCDIYSMALMAYELVVGKRPFDDESFYNLAHMHISQDLPRFADAEKGIPVWFEDTVRKAASKDKKDRFTSVQAFIDILSPFIAAGERIRTRTRAMVVPAADIYKKSKKTVSFRRPSVHVFGWCFLVGSVLLVLFATLRNNDSWKAVVGAQILKWEDAAGVPLTLLKQIGAIEINDGGPADLFKSIAESKKFYVKLCVLAGRELNTADAQGRRPIHLAVLAADRGVAGELMVGKPDVNVLDNEGITPLLLAIQRDEPEVIAGMIAAQADPNLGKLDGSPALHLVIRAGKLNLVTALLARGADVTLKDDSGDTPLHIAINYRHKAIVEELLVAKAPLDSKDAEGATPLLRAIAMGDWEVARVLIKAGASLDARNNNGESLEDILPDDEKESLGMIFRPLARKAAERRLHERYLQYRNLQKSARSPQ